ncbi:MAG: hypothetical protein JJU11_16275 [Candidatus Sumerlaeia bacterium]|nr:hypothetical protein [Candidatus Sumerlaeia bacterium]
MALKLAVEWEDPKRAKGAELRATWASLQIIAGNDENSNVVTKHYDEYLNTVRNQVYCPVYPLAEWITHHWFRMLHGTERSNLGHPDLRLGAEGFALPCLKFCPEGEEVRLVWTPYQHRSAHVEFISKGDVTLHRSAVEAELYGFLNRVMARLEEHQISDTPFQTEWQSILNLDQEEREFCIAAANLGLDPFDLEDGVEDKILEVAGLLHKDLTEEFFPAANAESLLEQADTVVAAIAKLEDQRKVSPQFQKLRNQLVNFDSEMKAWEKGYEAARCVRNALGLEDKPVTLEMLEGFALPLEFDDLTRTQSIEGIVSRNGSTAGTVVRSGFLSRRTENVKFALGRMLGESLWLPTSSAALVTRARTTRQKTNRAFAAELLAPAAELKKRLHHHEISPDEVSDLAEEFEVSTYVIEYQIHNHRLAVIRG